MINTFYGLSKTPFHKQISNQDLLMTDAFEELNRRLEYMRQHCGLMILTGEAGTGKTLAVRAFVQRLNPSIYKLFYIPLSTVSAFDFYHQINLHFGGPFSPRKSTVFKHLQTTIQDYVENARNTPILVLDEAHALPDKTLQEIPILLNFKMDSVDPLLMILIGQPDLARRLARPFFRNLSQRILLNYQLPPLSEEETRRYVSHHLNLAGAQNPIFSDSACRALYKASGGLCRLINRLCLAALNYGVLQQKPSLSEEDIYQVAQEI
jgi:type II secretory pathway predicted ATPase ExeA